MHKRALNLQYCCALFCLKLLFRFQFYQKFTNYDSLIHLCRKFLQRNSVVQFTKY